ncbi:thermonuclease family protein [Peribacillus saganii]|uniref:thermonuclease family protein n=1 Tax=Peribacillus saganii TaxID=2303992 RepID=UPI0013146A67|nr:thermonuclease family protein [Peribacillus saganii]
MFMFLGIIGFLLFLVFLVKGIISLFKRKKAKRDFLIAVASFIVFVVMATVDGVKNPPEDQVADETKEEIKEKAEEAEKEEKKDEKSVSEGTESAPANDEKANTETPAQTQTAAPVSQVSHGVPAKVVRVIDGDTIEVMMDGEQKEIRMLLIDTPETKHPNKPVEKFGPEASQFATETLKNKTVGIQVGKEKTDKYGRVLAYVWVGDKTYQEMVLEEGLAATAYLYNDLTMLDQFHAAQEKARSKKIGVWSIPGYAHVDHDHGFHYNEEPKAVAVPAAKPTQVPAPTPETKPAPSPKPEPTPAPAPKPEPTPEFFQNCTELREVYPDGVPASHAAYQSKMDRDKDNFACER